LSKTVGLKQTLKAHSPTYLYLSQLVLVLIIGLLFVSTCLLSQNKLKLNILYFPGSEKLTTSDEFTMGDEERTTKTRKVKMLH
jgi:hypothetical protein